LPDTKQIFIHQQTGMFRTALLYDYYGVAGNAWWNTNAEQNRWFIRFIAQVFNSGINSFVQKKKINFINICCFTVWTDILQQWPILPAPCFGNISATGNCIY